MFGKGGVRSNSSRKLLLEAVDLDAPGSSKEVKAPAAGVRIYPGDLPPKTAGKKAEKRDSPDVGDSSGAKAGGEDGPGKREAKDAGDHGGAYYMKDDALSKKEAASAPSPVLKLPLSAMSFLGGGGAGEGEGGSCPDVANCDMVCSGQAHSHSMCSTSQGHGTYTVRRPPAFPRTHSVLSPTNRAFLPSASLRTQTKLSLKPRPPHAPAPTPPVLDPAARVLAGRVLLRLWTCLPLPPL